MLVPQISGWLKLSCSDFDAYKLFNSSALLWQEKCPTKLYSINKVPVWGLACTIFLASSVSRCSGPRRASCGCSASCSGGWGRWWRGRRWPPPTPWRTEGSGPTAAESAKWRELPVIKYFIIDVIIIFMDDKMLPWQNLISEKLYQTITVMRVW